MGRGHDLTEGINLEGEKKSKFNSTQLQVEQQPGLTRDISPIDKNNPNGENK